MPKDTDLAPYVPQPSAGLVPTTVSEAQQFANLAAASKLLPQELQNPAAAFAVIATGLELGLSPMQALRSIHIVKGRPVLSADLIVALVKKSPECAYFRLVESTEERASYETQRRGEPQPVALSFSMADAKRAGLVQSGGNWAKYPAVMLRHRCAAQLARAVYPDVVLGIYEESEGEEIARSAPAAAPRRHAPQTHRNGSLGPARPVPSAAPSDAIEAEFEPVADVTEGTEAPDAEKDLAARVEVFRRELAGCKTPANLKAFRVAIGTEPHAAALKAALRAEYEAKEKEIREAGTVAAFAPAGEVRHD